MFGSLQADVEASTTIALRLGCAEELFCNVDGFVPVILPIRCFLVADKLVDILPSARTVVMERCTIAIRCVRGVDTTFWDVCVEFRLPERSVFSCD
jgi:hypothetical protein